MPKIKLKRSSPTLDMTPMVDLAFLLVTFFMLTTQFKPEEVVTVDIPKSTAQIPLPDRHILMMTVDKGGRVFLNLDGQNERRNLLEKMGEEYQVKFTDAQLNLFANLADFGVPINMLQSYLSQDAHQRKQFAQPGIPVDSANNELDKWILNTRIVNPQVRLAIKADRDTPYELVDKVIKTLQEKQSINRFNLITDLKEK